jgi:hypothetical protein
MEYDNPIIPAFYPDPTICRVGGCILIDPYSCKKVASDLSVAVEIVVVRSR